jgi:hypothetical protein
VTARASRPRLGFVAALTVAVTGGVLTGCADTADSAATTTQAPSVSVSAAQSSPPAATASPSPTAPREAGVEVVVQIADGRVTPAPRRVKVPQGATVRLLVTSDVADELHVHGYDVTKALPAGRQATLEFRADEAGLFGAELHEQELQLVQLEVR